MESQALECRRLLAAAGTPDTEYGDNGVQSISLTDNFRFLSPDGGIAVFPSGDVAGVARFSSSGPTTSYAFLRDATGAPKSSFGSAGFVNIEALGFNFTPESIAVQPDGKILIGGSSGYPSFGTGTVSQTGDFAIMRLNAGGSLDTTFGSGGIRVIDVDRNDFGLTSLYVKPNGKILAAGTSQLFTNERYIALMQLTPDGNMDSTFGDVLNGGFNLAGYDDTAQQLVYDSTYSRIIVASTKTLVGRNDTEFAVHQFFDNGIEDMLFGGGDAVVSFGGALMEDVVESVTISGGWIYVAGYRYSLNNSGESFSEDVVARVSRGPGHPVLQTGIWDDEYGGGDGFLQVDQLGLSLLDAPDGGFYLAGDTGNWDDEQPQWGFGISNYDSHGNLVSTFGTGGLAKIPTPGSLTSGMISRLQRDGAGHLVFARDVVEVERIQLQIARFDEFGNLPPVIELGSTVSYTEGDAPTLLSSTATITDNDSSNFAGGYITARISQNLRNGDVLSIQNQGTATGQINVSGRNVFIGTIRLGTFSGGTGGSQLLIRLNGNATPARVRVLLRRLQFSSVSDDPTAVRRTLRIAVNDGDGGTSRPDFKFVNVKPVNDAPGITRFGPPVTHTLRGPAVRLLSSSTTLSDPDSQNFSGGVLRVAITLNGHSSDVLAVRAGGTGASAVSIVGRQVRVGGVTIGTYSGGRNNVALSVVLNSNSTRDRVQTLLKAIGFHNSSETASTLQRRVRLTLSDGDGLQTALTKLVNILQ